VRPSDPLGRSVGLAVTSPPDFRRVANTIVIRECFTFQTESDVFRWCIKYGLAELAKRARDPEVTNEASVLAGWLRVASAEDERLYYVGVLKRVETMVGKLLQQGHRDKALELAEKVWSSVDKLRDEHWREFYRKRMKSLLDRIKGNGGGA
jgi:hypothetical protein